MRVLSVYEVILPIKVSVEASGWRHHCSIIVLPPDYVADVR